MKGNYLAFSRCPSAGTESPGPLSTDVDHNFTIDEGSPRRERRRNPRDRRPVEAEEGDAVPLIIRSS